MRFTRIINSSIKEKNNFKATDLDSGRIYNFDFLAFDKDGNKINTTRVKTATVKEKLQPSKDNDNNALKERSNNPLESNIVTTEVNENKVEIDWDEIEGVDEYEVYRDGDLLKTVKNSKFIDNDIKPNTNYLYQIKGKLPIDEERKKEIKNTIKEHNIKDINEEALFFDKVIITKEVTPVEKEKNDSRVSIASANSWSLRYMTFIPDQYVPNPWDDWRDAKYKYFGGDNRGFVGAYASSYRTKADIDISFSNGGSVTLDKNVGTTYGYDENYDLIGSDTASSSGIKLARKEITSSAISFTLTHSVGNPLTTAPNIDYEVSGDYYSNGNYSLLGNHDQAPNHEMYQTSPSSETLHIDTMESFNYLFPSYPNTYWNASN
ncbi:hypothetical protein [Aquibacillus salsiterrae]|uniref:Fibronectin type-III domain-containing protein n=1 Tax=Aquibacillus salsiterrae TaxID=2950439 RepID=A0A9X3WD43_9BACI|nr:hypothetical protein [Aquibacillus salsiterrae]MDC3417650.1 hypothetical protein [Aquibacillus salsiterrae]